MKVKRYTVEPGRQIHRDGLPFIGIVRDPHISPVETDVLTVQIAAWLNHRDARRKR